MKRFSAAVDIAASPQRVWEVLIDAQGYPEWGPGTLILNSELRLNQVICSKLLVQEWSRIKVDANV